jgi:hypothetical protein
MGPLTCVECAHPLLPHESLICRLGRLFHAACLERHLAAFAAALRRVERRGDATEAAGAPPPPGALRLIA